MPLRIETVAIGDELLTGKIADTNSQFVAQTLFSRGERLQRATVIPDEIPVIQALLRERARQADFVVCFGGLGPTSDDKTAEAVAGILGTSVVTHEPTREKVLAYCRARKREVTPQNLKQALIPDRAVPLDNSAGMAIGFSVELPCDAGSCRLFFLPGVPSEMRAMFVNECLPYIDRKLGAVGALFHHQWKCLGVPESELQRAMDPIEKSLPPRAWLGYRTRFPENHLTLYWRKESSQDEALIEAEKDRIRSLVAKWCYTEREDRELENLVTENFARHHWRVALAESCTGGLVGQRLTRLPGASDFFWGSYTVYQNAAKQKMLGVTLAKSEDAVSAACTRRLAEETLRRSDCEVAAAITGYMGPGGGTAKVPSGTIYMCVAGPRGIQESKALVVHRDREQNQWGAATYLLNALHEYTR